MKKSIYKFIKHVDEVAYQAFKKMTERHKQEYCCYMMRADLERECNQFVNRFKCAGCLIHYNKDGSYGIIIHDGTNSWVTIKYCPWCGKCLE